MSNGFVQTDRRITAWAPLGQIQQYVGFNLVPETSSAPADARAALSRLDDGSYYLFWEGTDGSAGGWPLDEGSGVAVFNAIATVTSGTRWYHNPWVWAVGGTVAVVGLIWGVSRAR